MERNSIAFALICLVFYMGYNHFLDQKYPERHRLQTEVLSQNRPAHQEEKQSASILLQEPQEFQKLQKKSEALELDKTSLTLENQDVIYQFDQSTASIQQVTLKKFQDDHGPYPFLLVSEPMRLMPFHGPFLVEAKRQDKTLVLSSEEQGWNIQVAYTIPEEGHGLSIEASWTNLSDESKELDARFFMEERINFVKPKVGVLSFLPGIPTEKPQAIASWAKGTERFDVEKYCKENSPYPFFEQKSADLSFFGADSHYFLVSLIPDGKISDLSIQVKPGSLTQEGCTLLFKNRSQQGLIKSKEKVSLAYKAWFGPKSSKVMDEYHQGLSSALDLGFFSSVGQVLFSALRWIFQFVGNWGTAIVLLTLLLKFAFYPLTRQAHISMTNMKKFQPQMNAIKEKNKDDPMAQQKELMAFMSAHKINPMKGCLPILPQIPVFIAFYRVLSTSVELRHAPFFGWLQDLSASDPYLITPVLWMLMTLLQQKLNPNPGLDPTQEKIMLVMPLVFGVMMISLPAGLLLYMLTNSVVTILQQKWLQYRF